MNKYGLYGKLTAKTGKGKELEAILLEAAKLMDNAKGCRLYIIHKEVREGDCIGVTEVWDCKEDHDNSLNIPGCRELISKAIPLLAGSPQEGITLEVIGGKGIDYSSS